MLLHELFSAAADAHPDALAVVSARGALTFRALQKRARQIAYAIRSRGIDRHAPVALMLPRSIESVAATLGILYAGGVYVPIDPAYPAERQRLILEELAGPVVLGARSLAALPAWLTGRTLDLEEVPDEAPELSAVAAPADQPDPLYILYTSGSTGRPKGVSGTHTATLNRLRWDWATYPPSAEQVIAHRTSLSFVDSVVEIFAALLVGHTVAVVLAEEMADFAQLILALQRHAVTRITVVPALLGALLRVGPNLGHLPKLRLWISSGEELPLTVLQKFRAALPAATLLNLYGSTEVTGDVTCAAFLPGSSLPAERVPIGRAIAGAELYVLDAQRRPVADGKTGELYVGGPVLASGYFKRPEEEMLRFFTHPCGARMFRTGDLVQREPTGELFFVGRADRQVKLRGVRIELEEVERILLQCDADCTAATVILDHAGDELARPCLVAWVTPAELDVQALRARAAQRLPEVMVPAELIAVDVLPLGPSGKVDRGTLQARSGWPAGVTWQPRTPSEQRLAALWTQVLHRVPESPDDTFFTLGGDSLALAELLALLAGEGSVQANDSSLLAHGTLAEVARWLATGQKISPATAMPLPVCSLDAVPADAVMRLLTATFLSGEPVAVATAISAADLQKYLELLFRACRRTAVSCVALNPATHLPIGFCLAHDLVDEPSFAPGEEPPTMRTVINLLGGLIEEYERLRGRPQAGEVIELAMTGLAPSTDGYQLAHLLEHTALASARRLGFRRAVTICTHRATVLLSAQAGFRRVCARDYATFELAGEHPLRSIPKPHSEAVLFELELHADPG